MTVSSIVFQWTYETDIEDAALQENCGVGLGVHDLQLWDLPLDK